MSPPPVEALTRRVPSHDTTDRQLGYLADELTRIEGRMIDPRDFGRLEAEVKALQSSNNALSAQVKELSEDVKELLALANRGRGGLWAGMSIAGGIGACVMWVADQVFRR